MAKNFFLKKFVLALTEVIFSSYNQFMRKEEFLKTAIVTFETQVSEERKNNGKLNFEVSFWVKTRKIPFLTHARSTGGISFLVTTKKCAKKNTLKCRESHLKNMSLNYKKI